MEGSHSRANQATYVAKVIRKYGIKGKLAAFVMDNARPNDTCVDVLAAEFGLDREQSRLRC